MHGSVLWLLARPGGSVSEDVAQAQCGAVGSSAGPALSSAGRCWDGQGWLLTCVCLSVGSLPFG